MGLALGNLRVGGQVSALWVQAHFRRVSKRNGLQGCRLTRSALGISGRALISHGIVSRLVALRVGGWLCSLAASGHDIVSVGVQGGPLVPIGVLVRVFVSTFGLTASPGASIEMGV